MLSDIQINKRIDYWRSRGDSAWRRLVQSSMSSQPLMLELDFAQRQLESAFGEFKSKYGAAKA